jgi:hypothetical protein
MASNPNSFTTVNSPESIALVAMTLSPRVHRIDYRVVSVEPALAGMQTRLFVPGSPDSEHPELAPFFAWAAAFVGLLGFLPCFVWFKNACSRSRLNSTTT